MGRSKVKMEAPPESPEAKAKLKVIAKPVDPIRLSEVIAKEVCRQHGATYRGHRFTQKDGVFEVSALGILPDQPFQTVIVGVVPDDAAGCLPSID